MKKFNSLVAALAITLSVLTTQAANNEFTPYWDLRLQGGVGYTLGESNVADLLSPTAALSVGYNFSSLIGVRVGVSGWQAKGKMVLADAYGFNYVQGNIDATLSVATLLDGYKADRLFTPYILGGIGLNYAFNNDEALEINNTQVKMSHIWSGSMSFVAGRIGVGTDIRICDRLALNVEICGSTMSDKFNSKDGGNSDWQMNTVAGLTYKFGKSGKSGKGEKSTSQSQPQSPANRAVAQQPAQEVAKPVEQQQPAQEAKPAQQPAQPQEQPVVKAEEPKAVKAVVAKSVERVDIFFGIGSRSAIGVELSKIDKIVETMEGDTGLKVALTSYADAGSGSAAINAQISKERVENLRKILISKGIAAERISCLAKGDTVQPFAENDMNRVVICEFK